MATISNYNIPGEPMRNDIMSRAWPDITAALPELEQAGRVQILQALEWRAMQSHMQQRLSLNSYATVFYKLVTFFCQSKYLINMAHTDLAACLRAISECEIKNMFPLDPEAFEETVDDINLRKTEHVVLEPTTQFICRVCGSNKSFYKTAQKSAGDEGRTIIGNCADCGAGFSFRT